MSKQREIWVNAYMTACVDANYDLFEMLDDVNKDVMLSAYESRANERYNELYVVSFTATYVNN